MSEQWYTGNGNIYYDVHRIAYESAGWLSVRAKDDLQLINVSEWCNNSCEPNTWKRHGDWFFFKNEADLAMFLLRWS